MDKKIRTLIYYVGLSVAVMPLGEKAAVAVPGNCFSKGTKSLSPNGPHQRNGRISECGDPELPAVLSNKSKLPTARIGLDLDSQPTSPQRGALQLPPTYSGKSKVSISSWKALPPTPPQKVRRNKFGDSIPESGRVPAPEGITNSSVKTQTNSVPVVRTLHRVFGQDNLPGQTSSAGSTPRPNLAPLTGPIAQTKWELHDRGSEPEEESAVCTPVALGREDVANNASSCRVYGEAAVPLSPIAAETESQQEARLHDGELDIPAPAVVLEAVPPTTDAPNASSFDQSTTDTSESFSTPPQATGAPDTSSFLAPCGSTGYETVHDYESISSTAEDA